MGVSCGEWEIHEINPMNQPNTERGHPGSPIDAEIELRLLNIRSAPRCGAKTRAGTPCECPAMRGRKRCRIHGGLSTGAPKGVMNGNFRDGDWTGEAEEERRWLRAMLKTTLPQEKP